MSPPTCAICAKPKKLYKTKRGLICARCHTNMQVITDWLQPNMANVLEYCGGIPWHKPQGRSE